VFREDIRVFGQQACRLEVSTLSKSSVPASFQENNFIAREFQAASYLSARVIALLFAGNFTPCRVRHHGELPTNHMVLCML
jgi:hypothetical protein